MHDPTMTARQRRAVVYWITCGRGKKRKVYVGQCNRKGFGATTTGEYMAVGVRKPEHARRVYKGEHSSPEFMLAWLAHVQQTS